MRNLLTVLAFCIISLLIGLILGSRGKYKVDWPEEMPGIHATEAQPDTVLMFKDQHNDSLRVWYYHVN